MIDVTGLDPLSLVEFGGGIQCFDEFGASGRARTMKIERCVRELHKLTWSSRFPWFDHLGGGAEGRGKIRKIEVFLTYECVIGS